MGPNIRQTNIPGLDIPTHDYVLLTYFAGTNNVQTTEYYLGGDPGDGGTRVAIVTFTYVGGDPVTNNANVETVAVEKP